VPVGSVELELTTILSTIVPSSRIQTVSVVVVPAGSVIVLLAVFQARVLVAVKVWNVDVLPLRER
jgi:hypothetical protein